MASERKAVGSKLFEELGHVDAAMVGVGDEGDRSGTGNEVAYLLLAGAGADPDRDQTGLLVGQEGHVHRGPIGQQDRHPLTGLEPRSHERLTESVRRSSILVPGHPGAHGDERGIARTAPCVLLDQIGHRQYRPTILRPGRQRRSRGRPWYETLLQLTTRLSSVPTLARYD